MLNNPDKFCYICAEVTFASRKFSVTWTIKEAYLLYFGCKVGHQNNKWAPHVCYTTCSSKLNAWVNGKGRCMPFGVPMVWRVHSNHSTDCYFCIVHLIPNSISMKKNQSKNQRRQAQWPSQETGTSKKQGRTFDIKFTTVEFTTTFRESDNISHQKPRIRASL